MFWLKQFQFSSDSDRSVIRKSCKFKFSKSMPVKWLLDFKKLIIRMIIKWFLLSLRDYYWLIIKGD